MCTLSDVPKVKSAVSDRENVTVVEQMHLGLVIFFHK